jgi:hypothetical protein
LNTDQHQCTFVHTPCATLSSAIRTPTPHGRVGTQFEPAPVMAHVPERRRGVRQPTAPIAAGGCGWQWLEQYCDTVGATPDGQNTDVSWPRYPGWGDTPRFGVRDRHEHS